MGLVMGTFSMQSKQVNYHKGKNVFVFKFQSYILLHTRDVFPGHEHMCLSYDSSTCDVVGALRMESGVFALSHEYCTRSALWE